MKQNFPTKKIITTLFLFVFGAVIMVFANNRTDAPSPTPGENIDQPIDVRALFNIKGVDVGSKINGGLGVIGPFQANQNANVVGVATFYHSIFGKDLTNPDVAFGDSAKKVKILANGDIKAQKNLQAFNLKNPNLDPVCATGDGTLVLCGTSKLDVCENIEGDQYVFDTPPFILKLDGEEDTTKKIYEPGDCYGPDIIVDPDDLCFNVLGVQKTDEEVRALGLIRSQTNGINICGRNLFFGKPWKLGDSKAYGYHDYGGLGLRDHVKMFVPPPFGGVDVNYYNAGMRMNFFLPNKQEIKFDWSYCVRTHYVNDYENDTPDKWQCVEDPATYGREQPFYDYTKDIIAYRKADAKRRYDVTLPAGSTGFTFRGFAENYPPMQWGSGWYDFGIDGNNSVGITAKMGSGVDLIDSAILIHIQSDPEGYLKNMVPEPGSQSRLIFVP